jgi:hypothetical protein
VQKNRQQADDLQERQNQLEMLLEWKRGLQQQKDVIVNQLAAYWEGLAPGWATSQNGKNVIRNHLYKFSPQEVIEAMDIASQQYLRFKDNGIVTQESWINGFDKVGGIAFNRKFRDPFEKKEQP